MHHSFPSGLQWDDLPAEFPRFTDPERWLPLLRQHFALIAAPGQPVRATAVGTGEAPLRLYAESLETLRLALRHMDGPVRRYVDVGSGGGFPGLVAAVIFPAWEVTLIDAHGRTTALLASIATELGLGNVTVQHTRAEEAGRGALRERACMITARAVAELRVALEYTVPLARVGGVIALPKGSRLPEEEAAATSAIETLGVTYVAREAMRPEVSATPWTAIFKKQTATPDAYPRRAGMPARRPL